MQNFRFDVDEAWAKAHNEMLRDTRRLRSSAIVMGVIALIVGVLCFLVLDPSGPWRVIVPVLCATVTVVAVAVGVAAPRAVGSAQQLYANYPLVPAVIAEVKPRTVDLLALVNVNVDQTRPPRWALALRPVSAIDGHHRKRGTQVPSVAVSGRRSARSQDTWDEITPMPIAWGTPDTDVIEAARKAIPHELWEKLEKNRKRLEDVKKTKLNLLVLD